MNHQDRNGMRTRQQPAAKMPLGWNQGMCSLGGCGGGDLCAESVDDGFKTPACGIDVGNDAVNKDDDSVYNDEDIDN